MFRTSPYHHLEHPPLPCPTAELAPLCSLSDLFPHSCPPLLPIEALRDPGKSSSLEDSLVAQPAESSHTCHYMRRACRLVVVTAVSNDFLLLLSDSRSYYFPPAVFVDCCSDEVEASPPTPDPPQLVLWRSFVVLPHIC